MLINVEIIPVMSGNAYCLFWYVMIDDSFVYLWLEAAYCENRLHNPGTAYLGIY